MSNAKPLPAPSRFPLVAWVAAAPGQALAVFLLLHAAVWTALPTLLYPNLPLDLIEALTYGREWQLGYDKLPPLHISKRNRPQQLLGFENRPAYFQHRNATPRKSNIS